MKLQQRAQYSGRLTAGAKKRLTRALNLLVQGTTKKWILNPVNGRQQLHQLTFITLTVSDHSSNLEGKTAYRLLLSGFLQWLRKTKGVNTYVWKAELHKSGQIHYHVTIPDFIHYREIRNKWNDLQRKAGLLDKYQAEHGHYDANSTDVHKVYKIKDVAAYLVKEIAKSCQNEKKLGGKVWDCSENLSESKYFTMYMREDQYHACENAVVEGIATKYVAERFSIYKFKEPIEERVLSREDLLEYDAWLYVLRDRLASTPLPCNNSTLEEV